MIIFLFNLFILFIGLINFTFFIYISDLVYYYFSNDYIRVNLVNISTYILFKLINISFHNRIIYNDIIKNINKINIINSNHIHSTDTLILFYLLNKSNIKMNNISSISTKNNISNFDFKLLNLGKAIFINNDVINFFNNRIHEFQKRNYNTFILSFFEGICLRDVKNNYDYKYLNKPKYLIFELMCQKFSNKKFYDIDIVYTYKNKLLDIKDDKFLFKILDPNCKIILNIKIIKFPNEDEKNFLNRLYEKKNNNIKKILDNL